MYKVELDGRIDDAIWTAAVKTNRYILKNNNTKASYFIIDTKDPKKLLVINSTYL